MQDKPTSTINMMVRDEPFCCLGLLSIINYVDNVLIYDTGSTDGTYENLQKIKNKYPEKVNLNRVEIPNAQGWEYRDGHGITKSVPEESKIALGNLRRTMHEESTGDFIAFVFLLFITFVLGFNLGILYAR